MRKAAECKWQTQLRSWQNTALQPLDCDGDDDSLDGLCWLVAVLQRSTAPLAIAHFRLRLCAHGTVCHLASPRRCHWLLSGCVSNQSFSCDVLAQTVWQFCSAHFSVSCLTPNASLFIAKCPCSPRIYDTLIIFVNNNSLTAQINIVRQDMAIAQCKDCKVTTINTKKYENRQGKSIAGVLSSSFGMQWLLKAVTKMTFCGEFLSTCYSFIPTKIYGYPPPNKMHLQATLQLWAFCCFWAKTSEK